MEKILNERLQKISAHISNNTKVVDIGCDHGLLGIYLALTKENMRIILSDINELPLMQAKKNVSKYHLNNKIEIILSDGLEKIDNNIDTVVISGMGAINMVNILKDINNYPNIKKLVLSPNNDFSYLREELFKLNYQIVSEEIVKEHNKYYLICELVPGKEKVNSLFGKLDLNDSINQEYLKYVYNNNLKILTHLDNDSDRYLKLNSENRQIKEVMKNI